MMIAIPDDENINQSEKVKKKNEISEKIFSDTIERRPQPTAILCDSLQR